MMQPSTTMMKIVAFLSCSVRYSMSFVILRIHKETLKPSSLPSQQLNFAQESLLPFVQISTNRFHLPKNGAKNIPETGINMHEFPFGTFRPGKQDYLFRCSVAPGNLPLERPLKCFYFPTGFSGNLKGKQPQSWAKWDAKLRNVSRFASVEDLKEQLLDKWCSSEDRYCKVLASWTVFMCLFFAKVKIAFL